MIDNTVQKNLYCIYSKAVTYIYRHKQLDKDKDMLNYRVLIKLDNGSNTWVRLTATNIGQARSLAEAQYGSGRIMQVITE